MRFFSEFDYLMAEVASSTGVIPFGFSTLEIYKCDPLVAYLTAGDFDGDGLRDLALANNSRSKIEIFFQPSPGVKPVVASGSVTSKGVPPFDLNKLHYDVRLQRVAIPLEKRVNALAFIDLDGNRLADVVVAGDPPEILVFSQIRPRIFELNQRLPFEQGYSQNFRRNLLHGPFSHGGEATLALEAKGEIHLFHPRQGGLARGGKILLTGDAVEAGIGQLIFRDLDRDGALDLLLLTGGRDRNLRFRPGGKKNFSREICFDVPPANHLDIADIDGHPPDEIAILPKKSGRALLFNIVERDLKEKRGDLVVEHYPVPNAEGGIHRNFALARGWNFRGGVTLFTAAPGNAEILVYSNTDDEPATLGAPRSFPSYSGIQTMIPVTHGDQHSLILFSDREKRLGLCRYHPGSGLDFPETFPTPSGIPVALCEAELGGDAGLILFQEEGEKLKGSYYSHRTRDWVELGFPPDGSLPKMKMAHLLFRDFNGDGLGDIMAIPRFEKPRVFLRNGPGEGPYTFSPPPRWEEGRGFFPEDLRPADILSVPGIPGTPPMITLKSFARVFRFTPGGLEFLDQYNPDAAATQMGTGYFGRLGVGASMTYHVFYPQGGALAFYDPLTREHQKIRENVILGKFNPARFFGLPDFPAPGRESLLCAGTDKLLLVKPAERSRLELKTHSQYDTSLEEGFFHNGIFADLNNDQRVDLALADGSEFRLEIAEFRNGSAQPVEGISFPIFEIQQFKPMTEDGEEPRAFAAADLNGDGFIDLAMLAHDRLILYLQDKTP